MRVHLRPHRAGSELLELWIERGGEKLANVVFGTIHDRKERMILSVRDQNTFDEALRKKRLMPSESLVCCYSIGTCRGLPSSPLPIRWDVLADRMTC